ncbi:SusC/RagA family TonB-linked outer membrane protein [Ravibacter arvi]|uniref:SusC/RagA family TonB-linked outer membrane protein n=1 Tax=Ravibacter arvi TaxID=2051041 RepID=A0ABP8LPW9_9BACT
MKSLLTTLSLFSLFLCAIDLGAQSRVTGKVTTPDGQALPGVNVLVNGTPTGTATDVNGVYALTAPPDAELVFSFIGYTTQKIKVGNRSVVDVQMKEQDQNLEEVVVTALGIKREAKTLGYATATVTADQIAVNRSPNLLSTLQGKMAGVNITTMSTGPAGTAKIRIRGQSSFSGQNNPLIVVNGVPIDNSNYSLGGDYGAARITNRSDGGDGMSSINPDDIESMTVLKGATAAALYGSRAKDGVVMITTKNGSSSKGWGVDYGLNFTTDTPLDFTDFQYEYGQGEGGKRPNDPNSQPTSGVWSFGEKFEPGMKQYLFDGEEWPYEPVRNRIRKFYNVGTNFTNTVSVSNGGPNGSFSLSFSNTDNKGIVPNSKFNRKTVNIGFSQKINPKLTASGNVNYSLENNTNPPQVDAQDFATATVIYTLANSMPFEALKANQVHPDGKEFVFSRFLVRNNPYYSVNYHKETIDRNRLFGNIALKWDITKWLYLQGRLAQDYYVRNQDYNIPNGYAPIAAAPAGYVNGAFVQDVRKFTERNIDFLLGGNHTFGDFGIDATFGGNTRYVKMDFNSVAVTDFVQPGLYTVMNGRVKDPQYSLSEKKINSLYGAATFSYKEFLYLNVTARNDWFSTLSPQNRSILYPSVTGSFVFSQAIPTLPEWISFGKVRAAYAEVGDDNVAPYSNALFYSVNNNMATTPGGQSVPVGGINASSIPNRNLKPLRVKETEIGLETKLFNNRVGFDFTYYHKFTEDQILAAQVSDASSYTNKLINVGRSMNKGVEVLLTFSPVQTKNFSWDVNFNISYNTSKVLKLGLSEKDTVITAGGGGGRVLNQVVGKPLGQLYTFYYLRNAQGQQVFDKASGLALRNDVLRNVGSALPKYFGGITNSFNYKGIMVSALIDFKLGNKIIAGQNQNYLRHGLHKRTLEGRAEGYVIGKGVNPGGEVNETRALVQPFYERPNVIGVHEDMVFHGGHWKLRQITAGYDFSRLLPSTFFLKGMRLNFVANNVAVLKKWTENMDPEMVFNTSDNAAGLDFWPSLPLTRSMGISLNARF